MTAKNLQNAWQMVNEIFPTDYELDASATYNAGYNIYRSDANRYDYICELGDRLEVNFHNGKTVNIWIEQAEESTQETTEESPEIVTRHEYVLTVGLFDKDTEKQEISTEAAERIISSICIETYGIFAFTMTYCSGHYRMNSTGRIVAEPSLRVDIVTDGDESEKVREIVADLKTILNQESIMYRHTLAEIDFL